MRVDELINKLRTESLYKDKATLEIMDLCMSAADVLSALQDENRKYKDKLEQKEMNSDLISKSELIERLEHLREVLLGDNDKDSDFIDGCQCLRKEKEAVKAKEPIHGQMNLLGDFLQEE